MTLDELNSRLGAAVDAYVASADERQKRFNADVSQIIDDASKAGLDITAMAGIAKAQLDRLMSDIAELESPESKQENPT